MTPRRRASSPRALAWSILANMAAWRGLVGLVGVVGILSWPRPAVAQENAEAGSAPIADVEQTVFDARSRPYHCLVDVLRRMEEREQSLFEKQVEYYGRVVAFERELETTHEADEAQVFEERFDRSLRARAFIKRLVDQRRRERIEVPPCLAEEPEEWLPKQ
jgi:hypothetical protein